MANSRRSEWWQQPSRDKKGVGRGASEKTQWTTHSDSPGGSGKGAETVADTKSLISNGGGHRKHSEEKEISWKTGRKSGVLADSTTSGSQAPSEETVAIDTCSGPFRTEGNWAVEPNVGRVADGISNRVDRIKSLGNAVVPQLTYIIGMSIIKALREEKRKRK